MASQDLLEDRAQELGWRVLESTTDRTVLQSYRGVLTVDYALRTRHGKVETVTRNISFEANVRNGSFALGETAMLIAHLQ